MSLIKRQFAEPALKDAIVLDLGDITRQAQQIREAAENKAQQIVAEARKAADEESKKAHNDASEKGFAEGLAKGVEKGRKQGYEQAIKDNRAKLKQIEQSWSHAVGEWDTVRDQVDREAHHSILQLALSMGEKVVRRCIEVDPEVASRQISDALSHVLKPVDVTARICPDDRPILEDAFPQLCAEFTHLKHISLEDDPGVTRGGCVLKYGQGQIDATIETQLQRIVEMLIPDPVVKPNEPSATEPIQESIDMTVEAPETHIPDGGDKSPEDPTTKPPSESIPEISDDNKSKLDSDETKDSDLK